MIQPRDDIVWVVAANGERVPFDEGRLARSILAATGPIADEETIILAAAIAGAVAQHLRERHLVDPVTTADLAEMVSALLELLDGGSLADRYRQGAARAEIRLDEMVAPDGDASELAFYRALDGALQRADHGARRLVRLSGLRGCVLRLRGARRWGKGCRQLAEEIVRYVYARALRNHAAATASLRVAVTE